jgi:succinate dehydrogenase / fumarate reductase flavoprotein subunit
MSANALPIVPLPHPLLGTGAGSGPFGSWYEEVRELEERAKRCALSDTGSWTNQNAIFARAFLDMLPLAKTIRKRARARDECRGAHYKPEFAPPDLHAADPAERRREAEAWCDRFEENNRKWLKSTIAVLGPDGEPQLSYEEVDTSLVRPRPRLYGVVGGEVIEEVWKRREGEGEKGDPADDVDRPGRTGRHAARAEEVV